jgi:hypothetical protein
LLRTLLLLLLLDGRAGIAPEDLDGSAHWLTRDESVS